MFSRILNEKEKIKECQPLFREVQAARFFFQLFHKEALVECTLVLRLLVEFVSSVTVFRSIMF